MKGNSFLLKDTLIFSQVFKTCSIENHVKFHMKTVSRNRRNLYNNFRLRMEKSLRFITLSRSWQSYNCNSKSLMKIDRADTDFRA